MAVSGKYDLLVFPESGASLIVHRSWVGMENKKYWEPPTTLSTVRQEYMEEDRKPVKSIPGRRVPNAWIEQTVNNMKIQGHLGEL